MKIGDRVRFLNEVGGGIVTGFKGKDIVLVEDADGFDFPMLIRECVVIETDDYNISKNFLIEKIKSFQKKEETVFMKLDFVQCELSGSCLDDLNAELNKCNINNHKYKNFTLEIGIDK